MRRFFVAALAALPLLVCAAEQGEARPAFDYDAYDDFIRQRYGFPAKPEAAASTPTPQKDAAPSEIGRIMAACDGDDGVGWLACIDSESPKRCRQMIYQKDRRPWALCVSGCNGAGLWRRTMGDCAR